MLREQKRFRLPNKGDLRVWNMKYVPCKTPDIYPVKDPAHAKRLIDALADSQLLDADITDNAFGLEQWDGIEWCDWYDEDGNDIDDSPLANTKGRRDLPRIPTNMSNQNNDTKTDGGRSLSVATGSAPSSFHYPLFELLAREHGLTLTETELAEIVRVSETLSDSRALLCELADCYFGHKNAGMMELMMRADRLLSSPQNTQDQTAEPSAPKQK